jgi:hypothetical protein
VSLVTRRRLKWLALLILAALLAALASVVAREIRTSRLQARYFSAFDKELSFRLAPGASDSIRFPAHQGPYDLRLGYAQLPAFTSRLRQRGFAVTAQARQSARMKEIADRGLYIPYDEKDQAGLQVFDPSGAPLYSARYPQNVYDSFAAVPPVVVNTLTYIEDRLLLDASQPTRNPWTGAASRWPPGTRHCGSCCRMTPTRAAARWPRRSRSSGIRRAAAPARRRKNCGR